MSETVETIHVERIVVGDEARGLVDKAIELSLEILEPLRPKQMQHPADQESLDRLKEKHGDEMVQKLLNFHLLLLLVPRIIELAHGTGHPSIAAYAIDFINRVAVGEILTSYALKQEDAKDKALALSVQKES